MLVMKKNKMSLPFSLTFLSFYVWGFYVDFFLDYKERRVLHKTLQRPLSRSNNGNDTNGEHYLLQKVFSDKFNHIGVSEALYQGPMIPVIIRPSCCHSLAWFMLNITKRKFSA